MYYHTFKTLKTKQNQSAHKLEKQVYWSACGTSLGKKINYIKILLIIAYKYALFGKKSPKKQYM